MNAIDPVSMGAMSEKHSHLILNGPQSWKWYDQDADADADADQAQADDAQEKAADDGD